MWVDGSKVHRRWRDRGTWYTHGSIDTQAHPSSQQKLCAFYKMYGDPSEVFPSGNPASAAFAT
eukprot:m.390190 g.390190  ORF g.390190 m.390190 type:complete len:63 (+) comp28298_c1_seq6:2068-2256(+)